MNTTGKTFLFALLVFWSCESKPSQSHCLWIKSCESCQRGWYGSHCDQRCTNCDIRGCVKHNGICYHCRAGFSRTDCGTFCPQNCRKIYDWKAYCDRGSGKCLQGCKPGWWGDKCEVKCSNECADRVCSVHDGSCMKGCISGKSGEHCDVKCPDNCISEGSDTHGCDGKTRRCLRGCKPGWWGDKCEAKCIDGCVDSACHVNGGSCIKGCINGKRGDHCVVQCPSGCLHNDCTRYSGYICIQGCKPGFFGGQCNQTCSKHCADEDCFFSHRPKPVACRNGCTDGWWSLDCQRRCPNCTSCDQISGQCPTTKAKTSTLSPESITLIVFGIFSAIVFSIFTYKLYRRSSEKSSSGTRSPKNISFSDVPTMYMSSGYAEINEEDMDPSLGCSHLIFPYSTIETDVVELGGTSMRHYPASSTRSENHDSLIIPLWFWDPERNRQVSDTRDGNSKYLSPVTFTQDMISEVCLENNFNYASE